MYPDIHHSLCVCTYACMSVHMYACMYAYVHVCVPSLYTCVMVHIFDMSLKNYCCHIVNMSHKVIMLNGSIDPTFLHRCAKTAKLQYLLHMLLPCMCQQRMCLCNATFADDMAMSVYIPHMHSLQSTM